MNLIFLFILFAFTSLSAANKSDVPARNEISQAQGAYLATDHQGHLVMSWVEGEMHGEGGMVKFAISLDKGKTFGPAIAVPATKGTNTAHGECPPKIAFKPDGTIVVVFRISEASKENPYAGDVHMVTSRDGGKTWSAKRSVAGAKANSRGYFDLKTLPNGEVGIIWLEGKSHHGHGGHGSGEVGSSLWFAQTMPGNHFAKGVLISRSVCQCCKTKLYVDKQKNVHAVFRKIYEDGARDMAHVVSTDNGKSFSDPRNIHPDKWIINGCPHVGPDMVATDYGWHFTWFTLGGKGGIYTASSTDKGSSFTAVKPVMGSEKASHPQMTALADGTLVYVWDEQFAVGDTFMRRIGIKRVSPIGKVDTKYIAAPCNLVNPVVWPSGTNTVFIAYTRQQEDASTIAYTLLNW